jgi:hypothetical protein
MHQAHVEHYNKSLGGRPKRAIETYTCHIYPSLLGGPYKAPAKTTEVKPFHPFRDKRHSFVIYYNYIVLSKLLCMP